MTASIEVDLDVVDDELTEVEGRLERLEADPVEIDIEVDDGELHTAAAKAEMLDGRDLDLEAEWEDDGLSEALQEWRDLTSGGRSDHTFRTTRTEQNNVYYNGLTEEERKRWREFRSMDDDDRERETVVKAAIEEESLASTEAALNRLARDREVDIDTNWEDDGLREALDELHKERDNDGAFTSFRTRRDYRTTYDGFTDDEEEKIEKHRQMDDKTVETEIRTLLNKDDLVSAEAALNRLARDRTVEIDVDRDLAATPSGGNVPMFGGDPFSIPKSGGSDDSVDPEDRLPFDFTPEGIPGGKERPGQMTYNQLADIDKPSPDLGDGRDRDRVDLSDMVGGLLDGGNKGILRRFGDRVDNVSSKIGSALIPSMSTLYSLFAALSPVLATVAVNALGVATAFGAVAGAGALIVGGGLLGHAQSLSGAMQQAQQRVQDLQQDLFEAFQPAMQAFAPISERILSKLPQYAREFSQELEGLTVFEDIIDAGVEGVFQFLADATEIIVDHSREIEQLTRRFGSGLADALLAGLEWIIEEAASNQDLIMRLGRSLILIGKLLYNLAEFVARAVSHFNWLIEVVVYLTGLLNETFVGGILQVVVGMALLTKVAASAATAVGSLMAVFSVAKIARVAGQIYGLISAVWALNSSLAVTAGLMAGITLGAAAVIGGAAYMSNSPDPDVPNAGSAGGQTMTPGFSPTGPGGGGSSGGKQVNINMYGDVREQDMARLERKTREVIRDEEGIGQHRDQTGQPGDGNRR